MTFEKLKERINYEAQNNDFVTASKNIIEYVNNIQDVSSLLREIGTIPESIDHDSTEEKLYAKASDAVLSKAFQQLGLKSKVLAERGDSADVIAESPIHGYTLVADAKAFRLSRTAKNQKDFKIVALSGWRKDSDYAVLCSPYFQYPSKTSQIYSQALEHNVCLFSWEHLLLMIENNIVETEKLNLGWLWNFSDTYANSDELVFSKRKDNFIGKFNQELIKVTNIDLDELLGVLENQKRAILNRGIEEINFWRREIETIRQYSREKAIEELIKAKKINAKIENIEKFIRGL